MDGARWEHVKAIFQEAFERPPAEQPAFLDTACEGDAELRGAVDRLLRAHAKAAGFLDASSEEWPGAHDDPDPETAPLPDRVGPYRVVRELGRGGMGTVYLAERDDPGLRKTVAVKVVRPGMASDLVLRRFHTERQILSVLEHPGIARLYDGGTTDAGLPYFVMEYVDGQNLLTWCDARRLSIAERLLLFRRVCEAVQFAHQGLVVHRDLKPSNILVTAEGDPKLLDFGIAKLLIPAATPEAADETATVARFLTPRYASPEQIRGERVTTASDVYSLGVILYELLTGRRTRPVDRRGATDPGAPVVVHEPARPSTAVTRAEEAATTGDGHSAAVTPAEVGERRQTTPQKLRRLLRGDLDNIVLRALRTAPAERYPTAVELADDIGRHLSGFPVRAQPDRRAYRAAKFVRRHRVAVAAVTMALLSVTIGLGVAVWEARVARAERDRAQRRFDEVRRLANAYLFEFHDAIKPLAGSMAAREMVVRRGLEYLDSLSTEARGDIALQLELAAAYQKVGDVQGEFGASNLGQTESALQSYRRAVALREAAAVGRPASIQEQRDLAAARRKVGAVLLSKGDPRGAIALFDGALSLHLSLAARAPEDAGAQADLAASHLAVGVAQGLAGRVGEGLAHCEKGAAIYEGLVRRAPRDTTLKTSLGKTCVWVGNLASAIPERYDQAVAAYRRSATLHEELSAEDPGNPQWRQGMADAYFGVGVVAMKQKRWEEALRSYRKAYSIYALLEAGDPRSAYYRQERACLQAQVAGIQLEGGDVASAEPLLVDATTVLDRLYAADPTSSVLRARLAGAETRRGQMHFLKSKRARRPGASDSDCRSALQWLRRADGHYRELSDQNQLDQDEADFDGIHRMIAECDARLRAAPAR